jgi:hypothetical protein
VFESPAPSPSDHEYRRSREVSQDAADRNVHE